MTETTLRESVPLAELTTLRVGGPARALIRCSDTRSVIEEITAADRANEPLLILGGGSNLVIGDVGFDGTALRIESSHIGFGIGRESERRYVTADAGVPWDDLVTATIDAGHGGLECLSGIPGSTGATPVQNVGAYGVEVAEVLREVQVFDRRSSSLRWVGPRELGLGYRTSRLKHRDELVVVAVSFWLDDDRRSRPLRYRELAAAMGVAEGGRADAAAVRDQVLALRRAKGMVLDPADHDTWSAGSFFTNPIVGAAEAPAILDRIRSVVGADVAVPAYPGEAGVKLSAGWLIERAGFPKGYPGTDVAARLSTKHTLAVTNRGTASAGQILDLARAVRDGVAARFGVRLHPEPVLVNCEL
ncbi:MAG: UDP-N-acetylmuramate dehydrogenase [Gordonia sp. (in: high G+C Gram-positive bacteria)]